MCGAAAYFGFGLVLVFLPALASSAAPRLLEDTGYEIMRVKVGHKDANGTVCGQEHTLGVLSLSFDQPMLVDGSQPLWTEAKKEMIHIHAGISTLVCNGSAVPAAQAKLVPMPGDALAELVATLLLARRNSSHFFQHFMEPSHYAVLVDAAPSTAADLLNSLPLCSLQFPANSTAHLTNAQGEPFVGEATFAGPRARCHVCTLDAAVLDTASGLPPSTGDSDQGGAEEQWASVEGAPPMVALELSGPDEHMRFSSKQTNQDDSQMYSKLYSRYKVKPLNEMKAKTGVSAGSTPEEVLTVFAEKQQKLRARRPALVQERADDYAHSQAWESVSLRDRMRNAVALKQKVAHHREIGQGVKERACRVHVAKEIGSGVSVEVNSMIALALSSSTTGLCGAIIDVLIEPLLEIIIYILVLILLCTVGAGFIHRLISVQTWTLPLALQMTLGPMLCKKLCGSLMTVLTQSVSDGLMELLMRQIDALLLSGVTVAMGLGAGPAITHKVVSLSTKPVTYATTRSLVVDATHSMTHAVTHSVTHNIVHKYYCMYCFEYHDYCQYCFYYNDYTWLHRLWSVGSGEISAGGTASGNMFGGSVSIY